MTCREFRQLKQVSRIVELSCTKKFAEVLANPVVKWVNCPVEAS